MTDVVHAEDLAEIRGLIDRWVEAFRARDVKAAMAVHADEMVSFDIVAPLRYVGTDAYREPWEAAFAMFAGPIVMELRDLDITVGGDLAFSRSLNRFTATTPDGQQADYWFRWTACFAKRDGRWLIVHDHQSTPTDFATGASVLDLKP